MVRATVVVKNPSGLHMRPAAEFSKLAMQCKSNISVVAGSKRVNPKSILYLVSAGISSGMQIEIECEGESEAQDLQKLVTAIESGLGE